MSLGEDELDKLKPFICIYHSFNRLQADYDLDSSDALYIRPLIYRSNGLVLATVVILRKNVYVTVAWVQYVEFRFVNLHVFYLALWRNSETQ